MLGSPYRGAVGSPTEERSNVLKMSAGETRRRGGSKRGRLRDRIENLFHWHSDSDLDVVARAPAGEVLRDQREIVLRAKATAEAGLARVEDVLALTCHSIRVSAVLFMSFPVFGVREIARM